MRNRSNTSRHDLSGAWRPASIRQSGLTLIELLVAISVLAFVAVLGWRGLDSIVRTRVALNNDLEQTRGMQLAFAQLQNDCARVVDATVWPGRAPVVATGSRLILMRNVLTDDQPSRVQVVMYQLQDGVLTRRESAGTRDLRELEQMWQAAQSGGISAQPVALQSRVNAMTIRLWANDGRGWRMPPAASDARGASAAAAPPTGTAPGGRTSKGAMLTPNAVATTWTGLEVALQMQGQGGSMRKTFLLGAV